MFRSAEIVPSHPKVDVIHKNAKCFYGPRKCQPWPSDQRNLPPKDFFSDQKYL